MFGYAAKLAGTVYDSQGESLVGALVKVDDGKYAALTGPDGSFSFDLTDGAHSISAEFMGCEKYDKHVNLSSDKHIKITIHEMATDLDEVVVSATATREKLKDVQIGVEKVAIAELAKTPSFLGENDIMKNIQTLPGVNAESEGASGFQVRGGTSAQNLVLLDNAGTIMPIDRYVMTNNIVEPQKAHQVSAGGILSLKDGGWEISAEGYYKEIENVYDYVDGKFFFSEIEMERIIRGGRGRSYGMELLLKKSYGKLTGWLGYTLSWSQNKINGINNGKWYNASNDRRHDVSIVLML